MTINRPIDKFAFICPDCKIITEEAGDCPSCKRKMEVVREGYIASMLGDVILKTKFPNNIKKSAQLKDYPWVSVSTCPKCSYSTHKERTCPEHKLTLTKKIVKLSYACKKHRFLFADSMSCPKCKKKAINVAKVHTPRHAIS